MHQKTQAVTESILEQLPENQSYFTPEELDSLDIPQPVLNRIKIELSRKLEGSIMAPNSDWADLGAPEVTKAWQHFLDHLQDHTRLPETFAKKVIESAVDDVFNLLTSPRSFLPEYIYGKDLELSDTDLEKRASMIVVYPHFGSFVPRYMQRKKRNTLSKRQYSLVINQLDERLSSGYTPLNWAQLLHPLFDLCDDQVPAGFLVRFFEDKGMKGFAAHFGQLNEPVSEQGLIEQLTYLDFEGISPFEAAPAAGIEKKDEAGKKEDVTETTPEDEKVTESETEVVAKAETETPPAPVDSDQEPETGDKKPAEATDQEISEAPEAEPDEDRAVKPEPGFDEEEEPEERPLYSMKPVDLEENPDETADDETDDEPVKTSVNGQKPGYDEEEGDEPLYSRFKPQDEEDADVELEPDEDVQPDEIAEEDMEKPVNLTDDLEDPEEQLIENEETESRPDLLEDESLQVTNQEEEEPMWKRFARNDEDEGFPTEKISDREVPDEEEESFHRIRRFEEPDESETDFQNLKNQLSDAEPKFIKEIFRKDDQAYENAVSMLSGFRNWREAGKFLTNEIFRRNTVDMYSDTAVDFTDRLHKFFIDRERHQSK